MSNNLYQQMQNQSNPVEKNFVNFMSQMRGKNPRDIINQMVQSGRLNQQQLNAVQQQAGQLSNVFGTLKSRFGF